MLHTCIKTYAKFDVHDVELVHIFLSGSGGTVKFCENNIQRQIKKTLYHCKDPEKQRVFLLGPTGISVVNIGGNTINSGLVIKPGTKLLNLNDKSKAALRNQREEIIKIINIR